jgi:hypothetical protein
MRRAVMVNAVNKRYLKTSITSGFRTENMKLFDPIISKLKIPPDNIGRDLLKVFSLRSFI